MNETKQAKDSILKHIPNIDNDDVLRSVCLVVGDYMVCENGDERANYIASILLNIVRCENFQHLSNIYVFSKAVVEKEVKDNISK